MPARDDGRPRSYRWGVDRLSCLLRLGRSSSQTRVSMWGRSRVRTMPAASPGRRDLDLALVPRGADVVLHRLEPERDLDVARLGGTSRTRAQ